MTTRSYGQHCSLAAALDILGQRWALLVVRDLAPGPRRFTELFEGLPGIATDVLADRLRALEGVGAVRQTAIRHPAPAKLYELTDRGRELAAIVGHLSAWGSDLLPAPERSDAQFHPRWLLQSMAAAYRGGLPDGAFDLEIDDEELHLVIDGAHAHIAYGSVGPEALLRLRCSSPTFLAVLSRPELAGRPPTDLQCHDPHGLLHRLRDALVLAAGRRTDDDPPTPVGRTRLR